MTITLQHTAVKGAKVDDEDNNADNNDDDYDNLDDYNKDDDKNELKYDVRLCHS